MNRILHKHGTKDGATKTLNPEQNYGFAPSMTGFAGSGSNSSSF